MIRSDCRSTPNPRFFMPCRYPPKFTSNSNQFLLHLNKPRDCVMEHIQSKEVPNLGVIGPIQKASESAKAP